MTWPRQRVRGSRVTRPNRDRAGKGVPRERNRGESHACSCHHFHSSADRRPYRRRAGPLYRALSRLLPSLRFLRRRMSRRGFRRRAPPMYSARSRLLRHLFGNGVDRVTSDRLEHGAHPLDVRDMRRGVPPLRRRMRAPRRTPRALPGLRGGLSRLRTRVQERQGSSRISLSVSFCVSLTEQ